MSAKQLSDCLWMTKDSCERKQKQNELKTIFLPLNWEATTALNPMILQISLVNR